MHPELPDDLHRRSFALQLASATYRHASSVLRANARHLLQEARALRDQIRNLLDPPPPTSTA